MHMKTHVAALVEKDDKYLIVRPPDDDIWRFPGDEMHADESEGDAVQRAVLEKLNTVVAVGKLLATVEANNGPIVKLYMCKHELGGYSGSGYSDTAWVSSLGAIKSYELSDAAAALLAELTGDSRTPSLGELKVGESYVNEDIMRIFLVSGQGGMRKSNRANALILFALHHTDNPYEDTWDDKGIMHYTGMGLEGHQSLDYAQNKTLAESRTNGVEVHLFESFEPREYIYRGRVELASDPYTEMQKDESGRTRQVVRFPLRRC